MKTVINTKSKDKYMARIPANELVTAQKDLSAKAFGLLMYYYSKSDNWEWKDSVIASDMIMTERKVKEYRIELIKKDYLYIVKGSITNVFIGRQAVTDFKNPKPDPTVERDTKVHNFIEEKER